MAFQWDFALMLIIISQIAGEQKDNWGAITPIVALSNVNTHFQSISPGLTENDILIHANPHELIRYMPHLEIKDIVEALKFIITRKRDVNVSLFCELFWLRI